MSRGRFGSAGRRAKIARHTATPTFSDAAPFIRNVALDDETVVVDDDVHDSRQAAQFLSADQSHFHTDRKIARAVSPGKVMDI